VAQNITETTVQLLRHNSCKKDEQIVRFDSNLSYDKILLQQHLPMATTLHAVSAGVTNAALMGLLPIRGFGSIMIPTADNYNAHTSCAENYPDSHALCTLNMPS
jgi:hypothetical protein